MRMKRTVSFLLALVMLLGLFAGCGQHSGETQAGAENQGNQETAQSAELENSGPPRIAEEFVPRLNAELKARDIPVEFVYQGEYDGQRWNTLEKTRYSLYQAKYSVDGVMTTTDTFDLSVDYANTPADPMTSLQIWVSKNAPDREQELHKTVCAVAAQLCDAQMTEETARQLLATEPSNTPYVVYTGEIGSFTKAEASYVPVSDDPNEETFHLDESMYRAAFCQSADLTHAVYRQLSTEETWYELYFDQTPETLFGGRIFSAPSVEELEQRINDAFVALGVPLTCTLMPYVHYGKWKAVFRWSTLEDPDYAYPEYPYEESGQTPEEVEEEWVTQYIQSSLAWVDLTLYAEEPFRKDAPVSMIYLVNDIVGLSETLCIACDPENGAEDFAALQSMAPTPGDREGYEERVLQKGEYSITQETNLEYELIGYRVEYDETGNWYAQDPTGEALLDPALLDYEFQIDGPMVVDSIFNFEQGYQTYFNGSYDEYIDWDNVLNDFLNCTRSEVEVQSNVYTDSQGNYQYYTGIYAGSELDRNVFSIREFHTNEDPWGTFELYMAYNTNVAQYLTEGVNNEIELEDLLRIPIGMSLMLDEAMTVEEAIALHTHAIEYDYIATIDDQNRGIAMAGFQVTVYGTGDVIHLLTENPETGENTYSAIVRAYAERSAGYAKLLEYLDD